MSHWLDNLRASARANPRRVMFPETQDERVIAAAVQLANEGLAIPVFETAPPSPIKGSEVLSDLPDWQDVLERIHASIADSLADKGGEVINAVKENLLYRAAAALKLGLVDTAIGGSVATTGDVLRAGIKGVGVGEGGLASSSFILDWQGRTLSFADCAVVPNPDSEQLARIAIAAANTHQRLTGEESRVALLSFSTRGSGKHELLDKVTAALATVRKLAPGLAVDGELQFDAAFVPDIARRKAPDSPTAGKANVYIFPDLNAANIGYKIAERMGGATATGPILNGLQKPWLDLSRGCSDGDIVNLAVIGSVLAGT